jgi:alpha-ketoglutarate-dependent taurine dioxygenase/4-hydroxybenzoate polyprenyltransferase
MIDLSSEPEVEDDERRGATTLRRLVPFGLEVTFPERTSWSAVDAEVVHEWVNTHRVVVLRGLAPFRKEELPLAARRLGPLQAWPFGSVNELRPSKKAKNYLYTDRAVPLHWDGAFAGRAPHYLFFHCVSAAPEGRTVFVDTTRVWKEADEGARDRWRALAFEYETERIAHYGGRFTARVVDRHPATGETVLRFAEPVDDLNPVRVRGIGLSPLESASMITELRSSLRRPDAVLEHAWRSGDVVIADNHALLHGRRSFRASGPAVRHIRRVNVLDPSPRTFLSLLRSALRIRRPEFMVAEIPILLLPALLVATPRALFSSIFAETFVLFFLLFHFGDMVNCLADRDLDAVYKTHLSEAIHTLGVRNVKLQIGLTAAAAFGLALHLAVVTGHADVIGLVAFGLFLGGAYSLTPLRLKARGLLQTLALWAVIFVGPMLLVTRTMSALPPPPVMFAFAASYAAMQQGIIVVNTAEDFSEDVAANIRTTAVALGIDRALRLAIAMVGLGAVGTVLSLARMAFERGIATAHVLVLVAPLTMAATCVGFAMSKARRNAIGDGRDDADEVVARLRPHARRMPVWITMTAWTSLLAAILFSLWARA